jgi:hypothetical protein
MGGLLPHTQGNVAKLGAPEKQQAAPFGAGLPSPDCRLAERAGCGRSEETFGFVGRTDRASHKTIDAIPYIRLTFFLRFWIQFNQKMSQISGDIDCPMVPLRTDKQNHNTWPSSVPIPASTGVRRPMPSSGGIDVILVQVYSFD